MAPGPLQGAKAEPSIRHWKVEPGSVEEKPNVGVESPVFEPAAGPEAIVVSGAAVSTLNELVAGVLSPLPSPSMARTVNLCGPSASEAGGVCDAPGPLHGANAEPSILHLNVAPVSGELNVNVGVVSEVDEPFAGPESITVSAVASTMKFDEKA